MVYISYRREVEWGTLMTHTTDQTSSVVSKQRCSGITLEFGSQFSITRPYIFKKHFGNVVGNKIYVIK
jgi:hypothetical protein